MFALTMRECKKTRITHFCATPLTVSRSSLSASRASDVSTLDFFRGLARSVHVRILLAVNALVQKYAIWDTVCDHPVVLLTSVSEKEHRPPKWAFTFAASSQFWHVSLTFISHQCAQYPAGSPPFLLSDTATMQPSSFSRPLTTLKKCLQLPTACPRALSLLMTD